ncbi:GntR family transcriptional regulator [Lactobacillus heilongjiangensis] [Lactiplantibacillus mudanjiangensis]|uniref:ABC transporter permease n=1 Tax=Lactiplantibacillus mudanjiangensis TaxID=1296538 RepID=UPI001013EF9B|nr:ABC transporter permease [Lactiplantibacillus mudanjiangensis]VDG17497.1 GntR family transcriptional regulator [Lactobacillus heilongjiangensis] [Lactiplantibacillus mudanjiangensis]VDG32823.1 GntR family transcriptional regulator [Lactobacillus heilongjiangensis] [Lactiplantibacillus mudanjiangensis]
MDVQTHRGNLIMNTATMAYRNLLKTLHNPDRFMDVIIQPVMFMLLFGYLFGGAIAGGVSAYLPTIVPGILIQTMLSAASGSGSQIREDLDSGVFDRFKSLPMAHIAPLAGQLFADVLRLLVAAVASLATGYLMGWHPAAGLGWVIVSAVLAIFTGWALSWMFALLGLLAKSATTVQSFSMILMMGLSFMSNAFIPIKTLPKFMQVIANLNPVTYVITAIRQILATGSLTHEALLVFVFGIGIVVVFAPLTVWAYNRN